MMRQVALLCHPYHRGGVTRWMSDAAAEWHARRRPIWFVAPSPSEPFVNSHGRSTVLELVRGLVPDDRLSAPVVGPWFEFGLSAFRAAVYARAVCAVVPRGTPLIVSDDPSVWAAAAELAERHPMIGVLHADEEHYYRLAIRHAPALSAVVAVSERIARRARPLLEPQGIPVRTIPCGILLGDRAAAAEDARATAGVRLVWVGRITEEQKRVSDLPRLIAAARAAGIRCTVDIVGDGPDRAQIEAGAAAFGVASEVRLHGWRDPGEVAELLVGADLFVLPSNYEGMPVAAMEALASGCAVVASRTSGLDEYEHHPLARQALFLHDLGDVGEAVAAMRRALDVPRAVRCAGARALAETEFAMSVCLDRYDDMMNEGLRVGSRVSRRAAPELALLLSRPVAIARLARHRARGMWRPKQRARAGSSLAAGRP